MRLIPTHASVSLSVCLLVTWVNLAKTAELIKVLFGRQSRVGPKHNALTKGIHMALPGEYY